MGNEQGKPGEKQGGENKDSQKQSGPPQAAPTPPRPSGICVLGGRLTNAEESQSVLLLSQDKWKEATKIPRALTAVAVTTCGGHIYAAGGQYGDNSSSASLTRYIPGATGWETLKDLPSKVGFSSAVSVGNVIYLIGGANGSQTLSEILQFDTKSLKWTSVQKLPTSISGAACGVVAGKIYIIGGLHQVSGDHFEVVDSVLCYDPALNTVTAVGKVPVPCYGAATAVHGSRIILCGGFAADLTTAMDAVQCFDAATGKWASLAPLPTKRACAAAILYQDRIFIVGGVTQCHPSKCVATVEWMNVKDGKWQPGPALPAPMFGGAGFVLA